MRPLTVPTLDAVQIRDKCLKLSFVNQQTKDTVTPLLAILAPLPSIIAKLKKTIPKATLTLQLVT
jgi:hypothetical protein